MALHFADLQALVKWLAAKHHAGAVYPMAAKTGLSSATMDKWVKGTVKNPEIGSLRQFAEAYGLKTGDVIEVASRPPRRRGLRALVFLLAGLATAGMVPAEGGTLPGGNGPTSLSLISYFWRRRMRQFLRTLPQLVRRGFPDLFPGAASPMMTTPASAVSLAS